MIKKVLGSIFIVLILITTIYNNAYANIYKYDELNRLVEVNYENGVIVKYEYDNSGNITKVNSNEVTSIVLNKSSLTLTIGQTEQLIADVSSSDGRNKDVTWIVTSGNEIVSVEDGLVTALGAGTAIVRVTSVADNTKYAECIVLVNAFSKEDVNKDGKIDILDISEISKYYNLTKDNSRWMEIYDMNNDGIIDIFDLVIIAKAM